MKALLFSTIGIVALWLQLTIAPLLAIGGYRPNLLLLTVGVMGMRWLEPWLFLYAVFAGLALDVFSHGMLGVYGLSFFAVAFLARAIGLSVYENNLIVGVTGIFALSVAEGLVAITVFEWLDAAVPWWNWLGTEVLPGSLVNALWSPLVFWVLGRLERYARPTEA